MILYAVWDHLCYGRDSMYGLYKSRERAEAVAKRIYDSKWAQTPMMSWSGSYDTTMPCVQEFELEIEAE